MVHVHVSIAVEKYSDACARAFKKGAKICGGKKGRHADGLLQACQNLPSDISYGGEFNCQLP